MLFIKSSYVKPLTGKDIESGAVLIDDAGKIAAAGAAAYVTAVNEKIVYKAE